MRVRVINTDNGTASLWSAASFRVLAIDGTEVNAPTDIEGRKVLLAAGGRVDVVMQAPPDGAVRLHVGGARSILVGDPAASEPPAPQPSDTLDLLAYGDPAPLGFDPTSPDRTFDYVIGRRHRPDAHRQRHERDTPHPPARPPCRRALPRRRRRIRKPMVDRHTTPFTINGDKGNHPE